MNQTPRKPWGDPYDDQPWGDDQDQKSYSYDKEYQKKMYEILGRKNDEEEEALKRRELEKRRALQKEEEKKKQQQNFIIEHLYNAFLNGGEKALSFTFSEDIKNKTSFSIFLALFKNDKDLFDLALTKGVNPFKQISLDNTGTIFNHLNPVQLDYIFAISDDNLEYKHNLEKEVLPKYIRENNLEGIAKFFEFCIDFETGYQSKITYLANFNPNFVYHLYKNNLVKLNELSEKDQTDSNFYSYLNAKNDSSMEALDLNLPIYEFKDLLLTTMQNENIKNSTIGFIQRNHKNETIQKIVNLMINNEALSSISHLTIYKKIKDNLYTSKNKRLFDSINEEYLLNKNVQKNENIGKIKLL